MNIAQLFSENFKQALMITSFVLVMMLIIEFVNVFSKGRFSYQFKQKPILQILFAGLLGMIPGCLGTYAIVSLYTHHVIGLGALVTAMISTTGDEAFLMLSMFPKTSLILIFALFLLSIVSGYLIHLIEKRKNKGKTVGFSVHTEEKTECLCIKWESIYLNLKFITFKRAIILSTLIIFIIGLSLGAFESFHAEIRVPGIHMQHDQHDHDHNHSQEDHSGHTGWVGFTFLVLSAVALIIAVLSTNHFLEHHLWNHLIKVHFLRIFLWTFGTLIVISILAQFININQWMEANKYVIMLFAIAIGLIPASGPHIIFISLFFSGAIPFSIIFVNSVVQDGHGALPLFAESKKSFFLVKGIKVGIGLFSGLALLLLGY